MDVGEADRISELPDSLLLHILSFLPTKSVISTSILSKRWRYLYASIPVLDFRGWRKNFTRFDREDYCILITNKFMNSVDKLLFYSLQHGGDNDAVFSPINISKFCLSVNDYFDVSRVSEWISTLIERRKVQHLSLSMVFRWYNSKDFSFPPCCFTCESLTTLELECYNVNKYNLSESFSFPSLKILRLKYVKFMYKYLMEQFISNCPVLEELNISCFSWRSCSESEPNLCISAPALKCLNMYGSSFGYYDRVIKIYAPNLVSLTYKDPVYNDYVLLHSFSSLVDANIQFHSDRLAREEIRLSGSRLLAGVSNVKLLRLSDETLKYLTYAGDPLPYLPTFYNLKHLEMSTKFQCSRQLLEFLQVTPNLESLVFAKGFYRFLSNRHVFWAKDLVPECLLLHLKVVEFREFDGRGKELQVINFFLKNARVLERMNIIYSSELPTIKKDKLIRKKSAKYSRGLTSCVITIS